MHASHVHLIATDSCLWRLCSLSLLQRLKCATMRVSLPSAFFLLWIHCQNSLAQMGSWLSDECHAGFPAEPFEADLTPLVPEDPVLQNHERFRQQLSDAVGFLMPDQATEILTWFNDHIRHQICLLPRTVRLEGESPGWLDAIAEAWSEKLEPWEPFEYYLVTPQPRTSLLIQVILLQNPDPYERSVHISTEEYAGRISQHVRMVPSVVSKMLVVAAAGYEFPCYGPLRERCTCKHGQRHLVDPDLFFPRPWMQFPCCFARSRGACRSLTLTKKSIKKRDCGLQAGTTDDLFLGQWLTLQELFYI